MLSQDHQGTFNGPGITGNPLVLTTDANGVAEVTSFVASQVSGNYVVTAFLSDDLAVEDTMQLTVRVPELVSFTDLDATMWRLTGETDEHTINHYCTPVMRDNLHAALQDFYEWSGTEEGGGTHIRLGINDMSLIQGGVFDIDGDWNLRRNHAFHRVGLSVDIDRSGMTANQLRKLIEFMEDHGGSRYPEGPIHYGFEGGS